MKTIEEFIQEVMQNDTLKEKLHDALKGNQIEAFLKEHNIEATADQAKEAIASLMGGHEGGLDIGSILGGIASHFGKK